MLIRRRGSGILKRHSAAMEACIAAGNFFVPDDLETIELEEY